MTFETIETSALPAAVKTPNAATIALGTALLEAITAGTAAVDPETFPDRKAAQKRAATLKRAAATVDATRHLSSRIYATAPDAWRVAIFDAPSKPEPKSGKSK